MKIVSKLFGFCPFRPLFIVTLLAFPLPIVAKSYNPIYKSAHAIVLWRHGEYDYILLGKNQRTKAFSTFGGFRESGEEDPKDTCAREIEEETLGVLGDKKEIRKLLDEAIQVSGFQNGHICYLLPAKDYGDNISHRFRMIRFNQHPLYLSQMEMVDIVPIRVDRLKKIFANGSPIAFSDNDGIYCKLRNATKNSLEAAIKDAGL